MNIIAHSILRSFAAIGITFGSIALAVSAAAYVFNGETLELELMVGVLCLIIGFGLEALHKEDIPPPIQFRETR